MSLCKTDVTICKTLTDLINNYFVANTLMFSDKHEEEKIGMIYTNTMQGAIMYYLNLAEETEANEEVLSMVKELYYFISTMSLSEEDLEKLSKHRDKLQQFI